MIDDIKLQEDSNARPRRQWHISTEWSSEGQCLAKVLKAFNVALALWRNRVSTMYSARLNQIVQAGLKALNSVAKVVSFRWEPAFQTLASDD